MNLIDRDELIDYFCENSCGFEAQGRNGWVCTEEKDKLTILPRVKV